MVYNSAKSAVTVTSDYVSTSLKASDYVSSVVTITAAARTKALNIEGNAKANRIVGTSAKDTINGGAGNDTLTGGDGADVFIYSAGNDVVTDYAEGEDTLKISGGTVSAYSISGSDATFKVGSGTVKISGGKTKAITVVDSKNKTRTYDGGLIYDGNVAKGKALTVTASYSSNTLASYGASVVTIDSSARSKAINIVGNAAANVIIGTDGNDTIDGGAGNDTLTGGKGKDIFVYESGDGNDVITDYTAGQDTLKISGEISSYSISGSDATFKVGKGSVKVKGGKSSAITVIDDDKNISTYFNGAIYNNVNTLKATAITVTSAHSNTLTAGSTVITVDASPRTSVIKIVGNDKNNYLVGGTGKDTLDGGKGADTIVGGKGADTIVGGKGNDTLTGDAGRDVFIYANGDGADVITDYTSGEDLIKLTSGTVKDYSIKNDDAILKIGSSAVTLKGVGTGAISVKDADNILRTYSNGLIYNATKVSRSTIVTITSGYDDTEFGNYGASVETIDASSRSKALEIIGNTGANYILGTKGKDTIDGGKGADTIIGGKGNDTLTGGRGADVFFYTTSDGNDVITDYTSGEDIISLAGNYSVSYSKKNDDAVLKIGSGNVTLQNAADALVTVVGANKIASVYGSNKVTTETYIGKVTIPSDALQYNGHSYYIYDDGLTWNEAKAYAEELGGHLVTITDAKEQTAVKNLLAAHSNAKNSYWMGATRTSVTSTDWKWVTGETWNYTNWGWGQPDGDGTALMMYYNNANGWSLGSWNDLSPDGTHDTQPFFGTENFGYIVEWETVNSSASSKDTVYVTLPAETVNVTLPAVTLPAETVNVTLPPVTLPAETVTVGGEDTVTVEVTLPPVTLPAETITVGGGETVTVEVTLPAVTLPAETITVYGGDTVEPVTLPNDPDVDYNGVTVTLEADRTADFSLSAYNTTTTLTAVNVDGSLVRNSIRICGDDAANILRGTRADSYIYAGKGNDVIYCGRGTDEIYYYTGDGGETVYDYQTGDRIRLIRDPNDQYDETTFKNVVLNGNDVIINLTDGSAITLKDAKAQNVSLSTYAYDYDSSSGEWKYYTKTFGQATISGGTATLDAAYEGTFIPAEYALNPANVDASSVRNSMTIYGDNRANEIHGTRSDSYIYAGKGNDVIYCGRGTDVIYYYTGDGNETVYDYQTGDRIELIRDPDDQYDETKVKNFSLIGNDVIINITDGSKITLKNAKEQQISVSCYEYDYESNSGSWKYYDDTIENLTVSGGNGNAAVPWFAEDDTNFTTTADLDSLIETPIANSAGALSVGGGDSLSAFTYDFALAHTNDK